MGGGGRLVGKFSDWLVGLMVCGLVRWDDWSVGRWVGWVVCELSSCTVGRWIGGGWSVILIVDWKVGRGCWLVGGVGGWVGRRLSGACSFPDGWVRRQGKVRYTAFLLIPFLLFFFFFSVQFPFFLLFDSFFLLVSCLVFLRLFFVRFAFFFFSLFSLFKSVAFSFLYRVLLFFFSQFSFMFVSCIICLSPMFDPPATRW